MDPVGTRAGDGEKQGYLPVFNAGDPIIPQWSGQEAVAFPDNWSIGLSFYHNVFGREHNLFVDEFRKRANAHPDDDSGLRDPAHPTTRRQVSRRHARAALSGRAPRRRRGDREDPHDRVDDAAAVRRTALPRHERELVRARSTGQPRLARARRHRRSLARQIVQREGSDDLVLRLRVGGRDLRTRQSSVRRASQASAAFDKNAKDIWSLSNPDDVNGGVNHFGAPFNFPEEFMTVYRLHPLVPDLLDFRDWSTPNDSQARGSGGVDRSRRARRRRCTTAVSRTGPSRWAASDSAR